MRLTVDLPDTLLAKAKRLAQTRGMTLRELAIEGLESVLEPQLRRGPFRLRDSSFGQGGLVDGLDEKEWDRILGLSYERRSAP